MAKGANMGDGGKMPTVAVRFPEKQFRKINSHAEAKGISFAEMVRHIVNYWDTGART